MEMVMSIRFIPAFALVAAAAVSAACAKKENPYPADTTTPAAATPMPADTGTPKPATAPMTDANITALMDEANAADSADGRTATTKGTAADVKNYGREMARDHHALRQKGLDLVKKLGITPEPPANNTLKTDAQAWHDSLAAKTKGSDWDKAYIDHEVTVHENVLKLIDDASGATQTGDLKGLLEGAKPMIQAHLDRAKTIQTNLSAAPAAAPADSMKKAATKTTKKSGGH
jgi:putative membrane protein